MAERCFCTQLRYQVHKLTEENTRLKTEIESLLTSYPLKFKEGWEFPERPKCKACGKEIEAVVYFDTDGCSISWDEECSCGEHFGCDTQVEDWDEWPFDRDYIRASDIKKLGFRPE